MTAGQAVNENNTGTHDVGFMVYDSFGKGLEYVFRDVVLQQRCFLLPLSFFSSSSRLPAQSLFLAPTFPRPPRIFFSLYLISSPCDIMCANSVNPDKQLLTIRRYHSCRFLQPSPILDMLAHCYALRRKQAYEACLDRLAC